MSPPHRERGALAARAPGKSLLSFLKQFASPWLSSFALYLCAGLHRSDLSLRNTGSIAHRLRSYGLWSTGLGAVGHGLSWASPGAQTVRKLPAVQEIRIQPVSQEGPLEEGMANHCSVLTWRIPWAGEPGYSPRDYKESDMTE